MLDHNDPMAQNDLRDLTYHWGTITVPCTRVFAEILHSGKIKVEWIRRIPFHGVAASSAFGIEEGNPFRDCIDSLLIHLEG